VWHGKLIPDILCLLYSVPFLSSLSVCSFFHLRNSHYSSLKLLIFSSVSVISNSSASPSWIGSATSSISEVSIWFTSAPASVAISLYSSSCAITASRSASTEASDACISMSCISSGYSSNLLPLASRNLVVYSCAVSVIYLPFFVVWWFCCTKYGYESSEESTTFCCSAW